MPNENRNNRSSSSSSSSKAAQKMRSGNPQERSRAASKLGEKGGQSSRND